MRNRALSVLPLLAGLAFVVPAVAGAQGTERPARDEAGTPTGAPLSVIDWLDTLTPSAQTPPQQPPEAHKEPKRDEPPVVTSALPPQVTVAPLGEGAPRAIGLVPPDVTGLPVTLWTGSDPRTLERLIDDLPRLQLPAAQALLYTVLLAEARAPQGKGTAGDLLALARVRRLMHEGAVDPALSLIEQAGVTTSADHFDLWMDLSLLAGTEDRACDVLRGATHLTRSYGTRIFCAARDSQWENAALTFGSAQALGLMPGEKLALLDRFLRPEDFEGAEPLPVPRSMDPLSFRLFEAIGEPMPTRTLPRAFAVADLRDLAGWKAQLEAAERLTRAGALPDNRLLGLYTDRAPAASGGIWDRVRTLQRFETALGTGSTEAVAKTLPPVWEAMQEAELEVSFASLFSQQLLQHDGLTGRAARIAFEVGLLSTEYEAAATQAAGTAPRPQTTAAVQGADTRPRDLSAGPAADLGRDAALLIAVARGETAGRRPSDALSGAVYDAFSGAQPRDALVRSARKGQLGEAVLRLLSLLDAGSRGDSTALRDALSTLRALGLEDTARRAALQILLLER